MSTSTGGDPAGIPLDWIRWVPAGQVRTDEAGDLVFPFVAAVTSHHAALVSTDREFGQRRMRNAVGHHLWLRCPDWDARDVLSAHLAEVAARLEARSDLTIRLSRDNVTDSSDWQ